MTGNMAQQSHIRYPSHNPPSSHCWLTRSNGDELTGITPLPRQYKAVRPSPAHHRFAVGDLWQASVPPSDLPAFPTKFDCETLEALLAARSYRKGASHDGSSTTDD